jgi:uncharacterized protein YihD (DUF1040 family)
MIEMRDPERIKRICDKLNSVWMHYPDMRLGQFLENFIYPHHMNSNGCIFYYEDDMVEEKLDEMIKKREPETHKIIKGNKKDNWKERKSHFDDDLDIVGDEYLS